MTAEWTIAPLGELVSDIVDRRGVTPLKLGSRFVAAGFRVISAKLIKHGRIDLSADEPRFVDEYTYGKWMRTSLLADDVILTSEAPLGEVAYMRESEEWCLGQRLFGIRTDKNVLYGRFLYYALQSDRVRKELQSRTTGTTVLGIRQSQLRQVRIPFPDIREQRAIAHILGALDDKIELNRRMNETLESMARALFKSWFIDFDPVHAKVEGRDAGLPADIAALFPNSFEDSDLGQIPKGWETGLVEDLAEVSSGKRPGVRYPEASALARVPLWGGNGPMAFVPEALIDYPFLLTGRVGTLGSVFRITEPCWPSDNTLILKTKQRRSFEYLFLQLKRIDFAALNRGSTQPLLTQTDLKVQPLLTPPMAVLEYFHVFAGSLYEQIDKLKGEVHTVATLRDTLLPQLLSGEVRVKDVDQSMEAHV